MFSNDGRRPSKLAEALSPTGGPLTRDDLPPPNTKRWVVRRKAEVVAGVRAGLISLEEACERYTLSVDEFLSWQRLFDEHGLAGLRTTRGQQYRGGPPRRDAWGPDLWGADAVGAET